MKRQTILLVISMIVTACASNGVTEASSTSVLGTDSSSVSPSAYLTPPTTQLVGCLPPLEDFAFPLGDTNIMPPEEEPLFPPLVWKRITRVPSAYDGNAVQSMDLSLVRSRNLNDEIWVKGNKGELLRYDVQKDQWETIDAINKEGSFSGSAVILFSDHENRLWAARRWNSQAIKLPLFMRFDDNKHQFTGMGITFDNQDALRVADIKLDQEGVLWTVLEDSRQPSGQEYQLYSLDLNTLELKSHDLGAELLPQLAVLSDDSIIVIGKQTKKGDLSSSLINYQRKTQQVKEIRIPRSIYSYGVQTIIPPVLFLDNKDRLWLDDLGWVDLSDWEGGYYQWFFAVRSPVFIGMFIANPSWSWSGPYFTHETPDGRIWYDSPRGAGWVDPETGKWCVFTSYSSKVLADSKQNLWIIVDGWLYRNSEFSGE